MLGVYLAPALHGMRYTTFGRHFTKISKLTKVCTGHSPHLNFGLKNEKRVSLIFNILHTEKVMTFGIWCLQVVDRIHPFIDDGDMVCMNMFYSPFFCSLP